MTSRFPSFWVVLALLGIAACARFDGPKPPANQLIYAPTGEPLTGGPLGQRSCTQAMGAWFDRVAQGAPRLMRSDFLAEADAQFARMDKDHEGELTSAKLEAYRAPYRDGAEPPKPESDDADERKVHRFGLTPGSVAERMRIAANPDPVLAADTNTDFKVTQTEYRTEMQRVFDTLDRRHNQALRGAIERNDVMDMCSK
jgi:hypothetical protein